MKIVTRLAAAILCWNTLLPTVTIPVVAAFTLLTFDVDGTLVQGSGQAADSSAHARAFSYAVGTVLGDGRTPVTAVAQALERKDYHGSTDGLILLRLARATLGIGGDNDENNSNVSQETLDQLFDTMYDYIAKLEDDEVAKGIQVLPGVLGHLDTLASMQQSAGSSNSPSLACGLVTGNVEGIARRKMRAVGVLATGALSPPSTEQLQQKHRKWTGMDDDIGFLGGFGSDYCSRNIQDPSRNYLDRGEQIAIAARRCRASLLGANQLSRVVHIGDAPADVLAAKAYSEGLLDGEKPDGSFCIGMVAVATGSYSAEQLREAAGTPIPGRWEPVILEDGMADPNFLDACGL